MIQSSVVLLVGDVGSSQMNAVPLLTKLDEYPLRQRLGEWKRFNKVGENFI